MRVLIISTNTNKAPLPVMPLGACIVADAAKAAGHEVRFMDAMFMRNYMAELERELQWQPDVVGISIRNIDNNDMYHPVSYVAGIIPTINFIKSSTKAVLVLGGAACAIMPQELWRRTGVDYVVAGNGEESFKRLLEAIECDIKPRNIPGLVCNEGSDVRMNLPSQASYDSCTAPDFSQWIDVGAYRANNVPATLQTKRGCPLKCVYCTYNICEGKEYRLATPSSVASAVSCLVKQGFNDIDFVDNVFNAPYEHAIGVCAELRGAFRGVKFHTMDLSPLGIDDALLSAMENAGFSSIGITAESASDTVLRNLGKPYSLSHLSKAALCVRRHKIPAMWIFMLGGPGETVDSVNETFAFARENVRRQDTVFFNTGIRIYPGTELENIARREGVLAATAQDMLEPVSYCSAQINRTWLNGAVRRQVVLHKNFIDTNSFSIPFLPALSKIASFCGFRYPIWKYTWQMRMLLGQLPGVSA